MSTTTTRQDAILKDAALAVLGNGFGSEFGSMEDSDGWNGLAEVSSVILRNLGENDLAGEYDAHVPGPAQVWVRTDSDGFTYVRTSAWVGTADEQTLIRTWESLEG